MTYYPEVSSEPLTPASPVLGPLPQLSSRPWDLLHPSGRLSSGPSHVVGPTPGTRALRRATAVLPPAPGNSRCMGTWVWTKERMVRAEWPCGQGATGCHVRGGGGEASWSGGAQPRRSDTGLSPEGEDGVPLHSPGGAWPMPACCHTSPQPQPPSNDAPPFSTDQPLQPAQPPLPLSSPHTHTGSHAHTHPSEVICLHVQLLHGLSPP